MLEAESGRALQASIADEQRDPAGKKSPSPKRAELNVMRVILEVVLRRRDGATGAMVGKSSNPIELSDRALSESIANVTGIGRY